MHDDDSSHALTRRRFLQLSAAGAALSTLPAAPAIAGDAGARPVITSGVQTGDVELGSGRRVVPHGPAGAAARPLRHDRRAGWRARARVRADVGRGRLHRPARPDRAPARPADRLRGALRGPGRRAQRAGARRVPDAGADAGAGADRLGRRRRAGRAGASTKATAACARSPRCAPPSRICSSTPAT